MNILLTGASGFISQNLGQVLTAAGHHVVPVSRRDGGDFSALQTVERWLPRLRGMDAVINAVGIIGETGSQRFRALHVAAPIALFDACCEAGVARVIQISALGADDSAFSAYHLSKKAADDHLRQLDLDWFVLRPSVIYGRGGTSAEMFMRLARLPVLPVIGDGRQRLQPVHIGDVVATVMACLTARETRRTLDIVGNEKIEYVEWLQRLRLVQGGNRALVLRLPVRLAMLGAWLGQPLSPMLRPENIRMLIKGYHADGRPWRDFLGRPAMAFSPALLCADAHQALTQLGGQA
ncbi:MAG TPA: NAD(P)H-binding protein [Accumulibacter sp.]|uniref:NAD-dependent epimerase/dehydratase family protein n=1 Tax=Accumulibacter sp. TaxID=2053492 RepID=UPI002878AC6A|nr:NAD-dependent epimerase/dehydratase family protein [Accumulibacter sp.]MDS4055038.1 NAD(P)H-binding protein [Accumulibacter sp.]HMV05960.1 NAD(P)H-binding protein [Accumulibacter sp.]HMW64900.1 NAD(P)H-binding protein [Accumulibacter sp.]HMW80488.1 NAD(P)H-binding protein [Accumulibacter sp.]HMX68729.1 NAD(P)H-binding protein [Accumulibacter sp.]